MVVVAVVAIGFGCCNEWYYRDRLARYARGEIRMRELAERHERERAICLERDRQGTPYDNVARREFFDNGRENFYPSLFPGFDSWSDEARDHANWIAEARKGQEIAASRIRDARRHLLFP
jgi:hypothetical protein